MIKKFVSPKQPILVTLRFSILAIFISLFLITMLLIIGVTSLRYVSSLAYTSLSLMKYASSSVLRELNTAIRPAGIEGEFTARLIKHDVVSMNDKELIPFTENLVKSLPLVQSAYWGDAEGNFYISEKERNGGVTTQIYHRSMQPPFHKIIYYDKAGNKIGGSTTTVFDYDPRDRPWFIKAKENQKPMWTDVYLYFPHQESLQEKTPITMLGMTAAFPVYDRNQRFQGVFALDVTLDYLSQFLTQQKIGENGFAFIVNEKEQLVAYPHRAPFLDVKKSPDTLLDIHHSSLALIDQSLDHYKKTGQQEISIDIEGESYLVFYEPVKDFSEYGWLVGVVVPKNDFIGPLQRLNFIVLVVSSIILLLGILIVSGLIARVVRPIHTLLKETQRIKHFELDKSIRIDSHIKEVKQLGDAIHSMKIGLKHFQRYVPKVLVQQLMETGEDALGGTRKQLVVFFTDIDNFTSIAERMDANELVLQIGEYFEALSAIILKYRGTIDKYIGDSIMAFWGAPLQEEDPCLLAAQAAYECQLKVTELNANWQKQGKPSFNTRIGIHMGDAIVGNLGSSERVNYTALGDTINFTSRLENANKLYSTKILVSEIVYKQVRNKFVLRMIDRVALKGRSELSYIYELLTDNFRDLPFDLHAYRDAYEKGFTAYQLNHWADAIRHFHACLEIYPQDTIAPIFIKRCENYLKET